MNLKKITYNTKMKLLPLAFLLGGLLVYSFAVSNTVKLSAEVNQLEDQVDRLSDAPLQIQILKQRLKEIEERIGTHSGNISQEEIFQKLSVYCKQNALTIREFPLPHELSTDDYSVETYLLEVEGTYSRLLKMVYFLEQDTYLGKVSALHFLLKKDKRTREEYLSLTIYLQTVN
ncbi:hypothetical protein [Labilibaculum euxinus]